MRAHAHTHNYLSQVAIYCDILKQFVTAPIINIVHNVFLYAGRTDRLNQNSRSGHILIYDDLRATAWSIFQYSVRNNNVTNCIVRRARIFNFVIQTIGYSMSGEYI